MMNLQDPQIWILASFLLFIAITVIPVMRKAKKQLDDRSHRIARQLREVADLFEETKAIYKLQEKEFNNTGTLIRKIRLETEQEIKALEQDNKIELKKIQARHNDRFLKQIKLVKDQYINDTKEIVLTDVMRISQNYIDNYLTAEDMNLYNENSINAMSFHEGKKDESRHR